MRLKLIPACKSDVSVWLQVIAFLWLGLIFAMWLLGKWGMGPGPICWFKYVTGIACPTCGLTRGVERLFVGDLLGMFLFNPLIFAIIAIWAVLMGIRLIWRRRVILEMTKLQRRLIWGASVLVFLANWAYVIVYTG